MRPPDEPHRNLNTGAELAGSDPPNVIQAILGCVVQAPFLPVRRHAVKLGLLLSLALVFAQTGALMHGYAHLAASSGAAGAPATSIQTCPDCLSFAPLLAAAGGPTHSLTIMCVGIQTTCRVLVAPLVGQSPQHAFLSRAPPLLA